jgi:alpha-N-arabinofuranosidase
MEWDRVVLDALTPLVDLHSIHIYSGSDDYWTNVLQPHQAERAIRSCRALIEHVALNQKLEHPPRIAYDEWNVWYRAMDGGLEERYDFSDALAVATYLNVFVRNCDWVEMANLAQMVNAIAPIVTTPEAAVVQPIYFPFLMHSQCALDLAVDVHVQGPTVAAPDPPPGGRWQYNLRDLGPFSLVDAAATVDRSRENLSVALVNRSYDAPEEVEIVLRDAGFGDAARVRLLTAGSGTGPSAVPGVRPANIEEGSEAAKGSKVVVTMPPQSFAVLEVATTNS